MCFYSQYGQQIKHDENGDTLHTATKHKFNNGGRGAARIDDEVTINTTTDDAFYTWLAAVGTGSGAGAPPTSITGGITSSSSEVEMPND